MAIVSIIVEVVSMQKKKKNWVLSFKKLVCLHIQHSFAVCSDCKARWFWKQKMVLWL